MTIQLIDYTAPAYDIPETHLDFSLSPDATRVTSRLKLERRDLSADRITLDGEKLQLESVAIDGEIVGPDRYELTDTSLTLLGLGETAEVEITVTIAPQGNTELMGLYMSGGRYCTQCEAEGFRRITYFLDRPDCLSRFTVRVEAEKDGFPTLLSNGDTVETGDAGEGRHYAVFVDPHPKPTYLFALVAGAFDSIFDDFTTASGQAVKLGVHVDPGQAGRAYFAMDALKRSMKWDEDVFQREYDLSEFHIVAVRDFNFGAMENKGLNIFNSSLLLADAETATDADFMNVERVVAHEYFHNWSGNRITLRDWFQLCLKEGLTVYRDQEFSSDMRSRPLQRIHDVQGLRAIQFPEDDGPLAHPPRPTEYETIDNFYTSTVYNKGAEVVRVLRELLGADGFAAGMQRYFTDNDGTAATLEDFMAAFDFGSAEAREAAFRWYQQAGTPTVTMRREHNAETGDVTLVLTQSQKPTPGQTDKAPLPVPLRIGFLDAEGRTLPLSHNGAASDEHHLTFDTAEARLSFSGAAGMPIPAILRGFNAPVKVDTDLNQEEKLVQMAHDPDPFTRWDTGQLMMAEAMIARAEGQAQAGPPLDRIAQALAGEFDRDDFEPGFVARAIRPASVSELLQQTDTPDPAALFAAQLETRRTLSAALAGQRKTEFARPAPDADSLENEAIGRRALRSTFLFLAAAEGESAAELALDAFHQAGNMTDSMAALRALSEIGGSAFETALAEFEARWKDDALVMDKWFSMQAMAPHDGAERVRKLVQHPLFSLKNPNRARAVYGAFANANPVCFHAEDGSGYNLVADALIELDAINPGTSARIVRSFETWKRFDTTRQAHAKAALERVLAAAKSTNLKEVITKTLGG
ncbi:aminopeptidase N [Maricaulis parjimensis]|uniref:aminopeptidase N n=1 Tax=Maricaulis parjimensis TaxID=144023 RepID=UPI00193999BF|nr:aminopeptidase N [Maricaulis parjimensis]